MEEKLQEHKSQGMDFGYIYIYSSARTGLIRNTPKVSKFIRNDPHALPFSPRTNLVPLV